VASAQQATAQGTFKLVFRAAFDSTRGVLVDIEDDATLSRKMLRSSCGSAATSPRSGTVRVELHSISNSAGRRDHARTRDNSFHDTRQHTPPKKLCKRHPRVLSARHGMKAHVPEMTSLCEAFSAMHRKVAVGIHLQ